MVLKKHLTVQGLNEIVSLKASLNRGLSENLQKEFPNVSPKTVSDFEFKTIPNISWISGFIEGEGCFYIRRYNSPKSKLGRSVQPVLTITQHMRDLGLLTNLKILLNCGTIRIRSAIACEFTIGSIKSIKSILLPLLDKHPLKGDKLLNLNDFKKVIDIMVYQGHLTKEGLDSIDDLVNSMNTRRPNEHIDM